MNKLLYLEISRGIAALLVVFHHAALSSAYFLNNKTFSDFFTFGHHGVDFFFVLSGFIIYYVHSKDSNDIGSIKRYLTKRVIRVYPIFLLISIVLLSAYLLFPSMSAGEGNVITLSRVVYSFLLLPSESGPILSVSWTLIHEMFFYIVFIVLMIDKKIGFYILGLWAILIVFYNLFFEKIFPFSFYLSPHNIEFLLGIVISYIYLNHSSRMDKYYKYLLFIGLVGFFLNGMNTNYSYINISSFSSILIYGISSSFIIYGLISLKNPNKRSYLFNVFLLIGSASYVIYLVHNPLLSLLFRLARKIHLEFYLNDIAIFLLLCLISVGVGIIIHLIIEKPTTKYLRKKFIHP